MPETDLTDVQKAYNVAQYEMFQLAAYGHHRYHPSGECLTDEGKRQARDYNDRLLKTRTDLEAGLLRLIAEHAETYFTDWAPVAAWLRFLADDPGELSMLALRPDERDDETYDDWRAESMTARLAEAQGTAKPPLPARLLDHWPRIPIDTTDDGDFYRLNRIAGHAATGWALGPNGTYAQNRTLADTVDGAVREALLHLLELGLIDIDSDRMHAAPGWPTHRERKTT
ncbi:hypothetical protein [Streptomyces sp. NPDC046862]|uniref:hypothetical protein n=1 Tax=Streptomyces sp. NPDC046862 TaxID=3154603 RepID=UPI0034542F9C